MSKLPGSLGPIKRLLGLIPKGMVWFLCVGVIGLATHTLLFSLLFYAAGANERLAWWSALAVATVVTWTLNRRLTFAPTGRNRAGEIARYVWVTAVAQGISYSVFLALGSLAPHLQRERAVVVGAAVATLFSYTGQRLFTFAAPKTAGGETVISDIPVI
jgi:putative flippase GtrA